jgi:uncharacterized protein YcnI
MKKIITSIITSLAVVVMVPAAAFAHVVVTPGQAGIGQELTFNVSVPNEQKTPVMNLRLDIPDGVTNVTPTAKDGWTITTDKTSGAQNPEVTSITWANGTIPVGQRADFSFSAQVPASATDLNWKAYQTYGDGTIVHWDQKPAGSDDSTGNAGPYSVTRVVNDLTKTTTATTPSSNSNGNTALVFSLVALVLSVVAFSSSRKKTDTTTKDKK